MSFAARNTSYTRTLLMSSIQNQAAVLAAAALFASAVCAQGPLTPLETFQGGLGSQRQSIDLDVATGGALSLGVAHLAGEYFISAFDGTATTPHTIHVLDSSGAPVRTMPQLENSTTSAFGYRDGATDGASIMFGNEAGIRILDPNTGLLAATIQTANGLQPLRFNPVGGASLAVTGNHRGVAYDPAGNSGNGSLWAASFASDLVEMDLDGNILTQYVTDPANPWSIYGLAWDAKTTSLWANSAPNAGPIAQIDALTGLLTGANFPRNAAGSAQGGLDIGPTDANGLYSLVGVDQAASDLLTEYRVHLYASNSLCIDGTGEGRLETAVNGGMLDGEQYKRLMVGDNASWGLSRPRGAGLDAPVMIFFNFFGGARVNGATQILPGINIPELVALSQSSNPQGLALTDLTFAGGAPSMGVVPAGLFGDGEIIRLQGMYPKVPETGGSAVLMASNQMFFQFAEPSLIVEAVGVNNFADSNYWRITNELGCQIDSITLDWVASSNPAQATMVWDTDQSLNGLGGKLFGGQTNELGCENTYRGGTEVATGLEFATTPLTTCSPTAGNLGFTPSNIDPMTATTVKTLTFDFNSFSSGLFVFDCDTDGGAGVAGSAMAGLVVTITTPNGTLTGEIAADPMDPNRGFLQFFVCP